VDCRRSEFVFIQIDLLPINLAMIFYWADAIHEHNQVLFEVVYAL
jgi:hypothetical protein